MLYVDSSALSKRYVQEIGSADLGNKLSEAAKANETVLTSFLTYAEIHAVLSRKLRDGSLLPAEHHFAVARFESDWKTYFARIEVNQIVLTLVRNLLKRHPLKASDAIQLASACWTLQATRGVGQGVHRRAVFATADKQLATAAESEQFEVFNPEIP